MNLRLIPVLSVLMMLVFGCSMAFAKPKAAPKKQLSKETLEAATKIMADRVNAKYGDIAEITSSKITKADRFDTTDTRFEGAEVYAEFTISFTVAPDIESPDTGALSAQDENGYDRRQIFNDWRVGDTCILNEFISLKKRHSDPDSAWEYLDPEDFELRTGVKKCSGK